MTPHRAQCLQPSLWNWFIATLIAHITNSKLRAMCAFYCPSTFNDPQPKTEIQFHFHLCRCFFFLFIFCFYVRSMALEVYTERLFKIPNIATEWIYCVCWLLLQDFLPIFWWVGLFCNICCPLVGLMACFAGFSLLFHPCVGWSSAWVSPIHLSDIWTSLRSNNTIQAAGRVYSFGHLRSNNHLHLTLSPTDI